MNTNKMTDSEKSIALAKLIGWKIKEGVNLIWVDDLDETHLFTVIKSGRKDSAYPTLYDIRNIGLAVKIMQWADENLLQNNSEEYRWLFAYEFLKDTQTALDNILGLAVRAGMVK